MWQISHDEAGGTSRLDFLAGGTSNLIFLAGCIAQLLSTLDILLTLSFKTESVINNNYEKYCKVVQFIN